MGCSSRRAPDTVSCLLRFLFLLFPLITLLLFQVLFFFSPMPWSLLSPFGFFSPYCFGRIFPFWSSLSHHFFIRQNAWKGVVVFPDNSIDHCHKILKVEKHALAARKETGSASWCCSYYSAPTPRKLSINHLLPPTQPQEEVRWGHGADLCFYICLVLVWYDNSVTCYPCATQSWSALN